MQKEIDWNQGVFIKTFVLLGTISRSSVGNFFLPKVAAVYFALAC